VLCWHGAGAAGEAGRGATRARRGLFQVGHERLDLRVVKTAHGGLLFIVAVHHFRLSDVDAGGGRLALSRRNLVLGNYVLVLGAVGCADRVRARTHQDVVHLIRQVVHLDHRVLVGRRRQRGLYSRGTLARLLTGQLLSETLHILRVGDGSPRFGARSALVSSLQSVDDEALLGAKIHLLELLGEATLLDQAAVLCMVVTVLCLTSSRQVVGETRAVGPQLLTQIIIA